MIGIFKLQKGIDQLVRFREGEVRISLYRRHGRRLSIISIKSSFFAKDSRFPGTARTANSLPPKGSISNPTCRKTSMLRFKSSASRMERDRMIGGLVYWGGY